MADVIDCVSVDEANRLFHDRRKRRTLRSASWLLRRNRRRVRGADRMRLDQPFEANRALWIVWLLKDDLTRLPRWLGPTVLGPVESARARVRILPLIRLAERLRPYLHSILAHCPWPLQTGLIEHMNKRIKVIKRMAYGFRHQAHFFLKIRAAFPGHVR